MGTLLALLRLTLSVAALAGPAAVNWQGRLADPATGNPVAGPTAQVAFRIYDAVSGGNLLWAEGPRALAVDNGQVDARMGEVTALSSAVFAGAGRWLEVEVGGVVLSPREAFAAAPWALRAQTAQALASGTTSYIQNRDTLQAGAAAYASSGSVNGTLTVYGLVHLAGDLRVRGTLRTGTAGHALTTGAGLWDAAKLDPGALLPNAALDASSVTKLGNAFNGPGGLVVLDGSGFVPAGLLDPAAVTQQGNSFNAASQLLKLDAGGLVPNALVDASSVVKVSAAGLIHGYHIDSASITLQGNSFNIADALLMTDGAGLVNELYLDASSVAKRSSTGLVHNYQVDAASITLQGNAFNAAGKLVKLDSNATLNAPASGASVYGVVTSSSINAAGKVREGGFELMPKNAIVLWAGAVCPPGWSEAAEFQGRVPVGACVGCLVGLTAGTAFTTNSQAQTHDHSAGTADPAGSAWRDNATRRTNTQTTTMPYRQMLYCRKDQ